MGNFTRHQCLRNDADDFTPGGPRGVCESAHESDRCAAVDESESALGEHAPERRGCVAEYATGTGIGPAKYTDPFHQPIP